MTTPAKAFNELAQLIKEAEDERLWGNIQLDFQGGKLVVIRRTETRKIHHSYTEDNQYERDKR
jgi:hypothetical protein